MAADPETMTTEERARWRKEVAAMAPAQRVQIAMELTAAARAPILEQIRRDHPHEDDRTHRLRLAATYIDAETMRKAFDWPPR